MRATKIKTNTVRFPAIEVRDLWIVRNERPLVDSLSGYPKNALGVPVARYTRKHTWVPGLNKLPRRSLIKTVVEKIKSFKIEV